MPPSIVVKAKLGENTYTWQLNRDISFQDLTALIQDHFGIEDGRFQMKYKDSGMLFIYLKFYILI
jgi:hypothetical protein